MHFCTTSGIISSEEWVSLTGRKKISVLSVVMDAPQEVVNALTGKLGMICGVTAKTLISRY